MDASSNPPPVEDNARFKASVPAPPRTGGSRYKEKFQVLREQFDQVNTLHNEYQRDLENANGRIRKLQAENNLLLDAISIAVPATPSLMHLMGPSPTGTSSSVPMSSYTYPPPPHHHPQVQAHAQQQQQASVPTNGHGYDYDHVNGRYRDYDREYERSEVDGRNHQIDPVDRSNGPSPYGSSVNGRSL